MAKKKDEAVPQAPLKGGFLATLTKATGITLIPVSELIQNDKTTYTDTGSYTLNALISGSIFGGIPSDTIVGLAGEKATGKTYMCLSICKQFLEKNPEGLVFYYDTEAAVKPHMVMSRGIPEARFNLMKVNTIEQFRLEAIRTIDHYMKYPESERPPMLMVLDSLGNISTVKEIKEAAVDLDKQTKDMTKAQLIRSVFRVMSIKLAEANVPLIVTNHVGVKIGGFSRPGAPPAVEMCLVEGTNIRSADGLIEIENVVVGDTLPTTSEPDTVNKVFAFQSDDVYEIMFEDGTTVRCTGRHKFLLPSLEWIETSKLSFNDRVMAVD